MNIRQVAAYEHRGLLRSSRHSLSRVLCFDGFPYVIAFVFSTPAFPTLPHFQRPIHDLTSTLAVMTTWFDFQYHVSY